MIRQDREFMNEPTVGFAALVEEIGESLLNLRIENLAPVLGNEDDVVEETMHGVPAMPEDSF